MIGSKRVGCGVVLAAAALAACSPQQAPPTPQASASSPAASASAAAAPATVEPPMTNGLYIQVGACPGEGCALKGRIKAYEAVDLLESASTAAMVVTRLEAGEWAEIIETEDRLVPVRGVVRTAGENLAVGDVVYMLGSEGEGCSTVWNRGKLASWCDAGPDEAATSAIQWDDDTPNADPTIGFWVQIRRANGQTGWLPNDGLGKLGCIGQQDRDADCPPL